LVKNILAVKKDEKGQLYLKSKEQKLTAPKPNRFDGKLYVLTNGGSFSASCILSSNLKNSSRAVFVGEETGGTYNGTVAGTMPLLELPNSKLLFRIGLQDIRPVKETTEFGRGILPDVTIVPTSEQIIDDKDPELDWIIEDVKNN
jgi:C-terminal processing protease CtpA/Prc